MVELREDGKYNAICKVCGAEVIVSRKHGEGANVVTTPPEDHSGVCRSKVMLGKRKSWVNGGLR